MSYSNAFLRDFRPVFLGILREKNLPPEQVALEIIDEEPLGPGIFEPAGVMEVLGQLEGDLNFLTIYTERPAYFYEFAETMYQEHGLLVRLFSKEEGRRQETLRAIATLILDFEWEGVCHFQQIQKGRYYIPIHKKPWRQGENLDIMIPIGYNTVIVKRIREEKQRSGFDRFEEAFYNS